MVLPARWVSRSPGAAGLLGQGRSVLGLERATRQRLETQAEALSYSS